MKTNPLHIVFWIGLLLIALTATLHGAEPDAAVNESASETLNGILLIAITVVAPIMVRGFKMIFPKIPSWFLPILAPALVSLANWLSQVAGGPHVDPILAALLGAAGTGIREIKDQVQKKATVGGAAAMLVLFTLAIPVVTLTGCKSTGVVVVAANADPVVVHAEWLSENATYALDEFLLWEWNNRETLADRMPAVVESAKALRKDDNAKNQLLELRRLTREYKTNRSDLNGSRLKLYTNTILSLINSVRGNMGLPALVLPNVDEPFRGA